MARTNIVNRWGAMKRKNLIELFSKLDYLVALVAVVAGSILLLNGNYNWGALAIASAAFSTFMGWLQPGKRIQRHLERKMFKKRAHH